MTGGSKQRTTKWLVRRVAGDTPGLPPDLDDSLAVTVAMKAAFIENGGTQTQLDDGKSHLDQYYAGAPLSDFSIDQKGVFLCYVDLTYAWSDNNSSNTGVSNLSLRTESSLSSVTVKNGLRSKFVFAPTFADSPFKQGGVFAGNAAADWQEALRQMSNDDSYDTILNPNIDGVSQGATIQVPVVKLSYTFKLDYDEARVAFGMLPNGSADPDDAVAWDLWSNDYEEILVALTGRVNSVAFNGRPPGTLRFDTGAGTVNDRGEIDFTWNFSRQELSIPTGLPKMVPIRYEGEAIAWGVGSTPVWYTQAMIDAYGTWGSLDVAADGYPEVFPVFDGWDGLSVVYDTVETDGGLEVASKIKRAATIGILPEADLNYLRIPGITPAVAIPA